MIWNREMETMNRKDLAALQLQRLGETAARVYARVPFYQRKFDEAGVRPDDVRDLSDLTRLPFTRKTDIREHYPFGLFAEPLEKVLRLHASSGTKGKPTVVGYTRADIAMWAELMARCFCSAGGEPGQIFQNAYGYGLFTGGLGFHYGVETAGALVVPMSGGNTPRQIDLMMDFQPRGLGCTPSYALNIADVMADRGLDPRESPIRFGIFGAEPWSDAMRRQIEARLNISAVDIYGLSELIGPGVSCECYQAKNGLHINEDHFLAEVINSDSGEPLPYGEQGELVLTSLTKEAFPVIRHRTGDICTLSPEPCRCGRTQVRMSRIKGRVDDMIVIRGVNIFPSEVERELLAFQELAPHYQLVVDRRRALADVEIQVELADPILRAWGEFDAGRPEARALSQRIAQRAKDYLGISISVTLMPPKAVPRSEGKAIRVVEKRSL